MSRPRPVHLRTRPVARRRPMPSRPRVRPAAARGWAVVSSVLLAVGLVAGAVGPAHAAQAGWADFTFTGTSREFSGTMQQPAAGFPTATYTSDSVGGLVGVQTGTSVFLPPQTPVAAKYGTSQGQEYLNLRPNNQSGPPPSVTTYTFARPTPDSGWTFVLGDIDADRVQITATGIGGRAVTAAELGFQSAFNYCAADVTPKPSCGPPNNSGTDLPTWNPATATLDGHPVNLDTAGASGWFEPTVSLTTLTFTYIRDAGFPVYQTWFSALEYDLSGTVTAPDGQRGGLTVQLFDAQRHLIATTQTAEDGTYSFPGYATYDDYRVAVQRPPGLTSDQPLTQTVDLSDGDAEADFTLRAIVPSDVSGTITDSAGNPVGGVTVTLDDDAGNEIATTTSNADGSYVFDNVPTGDNYTLTATAPAGARVSAPLTFSIPADTEAPVTGQDFVVTAAPTGTVSGTVTSQGDGPRAGVLITVAGGGNTYTARSQDDGSWSLTDLPLGTYTATITPPEGTTVVGDAATPFTLTDDDLTATATFVLEIPAPPAYTASGTVTDDQNNPVPGADVTLTDPASGTQATITTDEDGTWSVDDLEPAAGYTAELRVPPGYTAAGPTTLTFDIADDTTGLDFTVAHIAPTPIPTPTTATPQPMPTPDHTSSGPPTTDDDSDDDTGSGSNDAPSGSLASTGGPPLLIGLIGVLLVTIGAVTIITKTRGRN